jgi:hypothetical protein
MLPSSAHIDHAESTAEWQAALDALAEAPEDQALLDAEVEARARVAVTGAAVLDWKLTERRAAHLAAAAARRANPVA